MTRSARDRYAADPRDVRVDGKPTAPPSTQEAAKTKKKRKRRYSENPPAT